MFKQDEMMVRLIIEGMKGDNFPVGMMGGAKMESLEGIRMRCNKMTLFARMEGDELIDFERFLPYGFLHVDAPELREHTIVSIRHKLDFRNAWIFQESRLFDEPACEVHVTYKRAGGGKTLFRGILPHIEYMVFYKGVFNDICVPELREYALADKPIFRLYGHERDINDVQFGVDNSLF
ncbi:MAG: hypothetical protein AABN34_01015 [Acidobacteriota bacterium]